MNNHKCSKQKESGFEPVSNLIEPEISKVGFTTIELNDDTKKIFGMMCFQCMNIASRLRELGHVIGFKAEDEQAHVIHFLLSQYMQHGDAWRAKTEEFLHKKNLNSGV